MNIKRIVPALLALGLLTALPVFSRDYNHWRTNASYVQGSSIGQYSTNEAYNIYDTFTDPASDLFSEYWKSALRTDAVPGVDNREEDPDVVDWTAWVTALGRPAV